jgi:hypothetical protein
MAPEQFSKAQGVGPTTDIWAFGATLAHMLSGRAPFERLTIYEVGVLVEREGKHPDVPWQAECSGTLRSLLMACFSHDPKSRPSAAQLLEQVVQAQQECAAAAGKGGDVKDQLISTPEVSKSPRKQQQQQQQQQQPGQDAGVGRGPSRNDTAFYSLIGGAPPVMVPPAADSPAAYPKVGGGGAAQWPSSSAGQRPWHLQGRLPQKALHTGRLQGKAKTLGHLLLAGGACRRLGLGHATCTICTAAAAACGASVAGDVATAAAHAAAGRPWPTQHASREPQSAVCAAAAAAAAPAAAAPAPAPGAHAYQQQVILSRSERSH